MSETHSLPKARQASLIYLQHTILIVILILLLVTAGVFLFLNCETSFPGTVMILTDRDSS